MYLLIFVAVLKALKKKVGPDLSFLDQKLQIYLSLDLHIGGPSYRRSFQLSKEHIWHFRKFNLRDFHPNAAFRN